MTRRCFVPAAPVLRFFYRKTRRLTIWDPRGNKLISVSPSDDTFVTLTARIRLMKNMTTSQTLSYVGDIIRARASGGKSRFIDGAAADGSPPPRPSTDYCNIMRYNPTYNIYSPQGPSSFHQMNADTFGNLWVNILPVMGGIVNFCFKSWVWFSSQPFYDNRSRIRWLRVVLWCRTFGVWKLSGR